jgi:transposase
MKIALTLSPCESETLFQLSINHPWRDARLRAAGLLMLSKGEHPTAIGQQCGVSHQSIYNWRHAWEQEGLVGLISGHAGGRPKKLNDAWLATVCELARTEALTLRGLVQRAEAIHGEPFPLSLDRLGVILRQSGFSFKRTRMSLKKAATRNDLPLAPTKLPV